MKRGIITATTATCAMALLLLFWGCDEEGAFYDSELSSDSDKSSDYVVPECIRYVDSDVIESGDGLSWEKAVSTVEEAADILPLDTESSECEIWVKGELAAEGNSSSIPADLDNVNIVDGFSGSEVSRPALASISSGDNDISNRFSVNSPTRIVQRDNISLSNRDVIDHGRNVISSDNSGVPKSDGTSDFYQITGMDPYLWLDDNHSNEDWRIQSFHGGHLHLYQYPSSINDHNIALGPNKGTVSIGTDFLTNTNVFDADLTIYSTNSLNVPPTPIPDVQHAILHLTADGSSDKNSSKIIFSDYDAPTTQNFEIDFNVGDQDLHFRSDQKHLMTMTNNGRVGVRVTNPTSTLEVRGYENNGTRGTMKIVDGADRMIFDGNEIDVFGGHNLEINKNSGKDVRLVNGTEGGHVLIGTNTVHDRALLTVDGKISAEQLVLEGGIADYVFADDYQLMSLEEVEEFIQENRHLPNVPGEKEVAANGKNIGEIQVRLLEKIEELTLHLIDQNKQLKEQKEEIRQLQETIGGNY